MVRRYLHSFIPASLYRSRTAFPALSRARQELDRQAPPAAVEILNRAKPELCARLRPRFPESARRGVDAQGFESFPGPVSLPGA